jgi:acyl-coenzyme A thioesterase PaaI-like protein
MRFKKKIDGKTCHHFFFFKTTVNPPKRTLMSKKAIQDYYEDDVAVCYGCGRNNSNGLRVKTHWDGKEGLCRFTPQSHHTAFPGYVYGGLLASLIDCHSTGTATAAAYDAEGREPGSDPPIRFVTGTLMVRYLRPTPIGEELVLRAQVKELGEKKAVIDCGLFAGETECVHGEVIVIRAPKIMMPGKTEI